ncbi:hypothetical protein ACPYPG_04275 [Streptomyces sp. FR-108]|uniref:hypothetical protein n=1 Tax=Streptomyces sp. FR-108 TaxID=3416665 RepID=UPI003CF13B0F
MGVGLLAENGVHYSAVWGSSFGHHGLEIYRAPMPGQLTMIGQPGGTPAVTVTRHHAWAGLIGVPLLGAEILWSEGDHELRLPVAVQLRAPAAAVWIVAGRPRHDPPEEGFDLGTDDVMTVFTHEFAAAVAGTVKRAVYPGE